MQSGNIVNDPVVSIVATRTIGPYRLLVHIFMTGNAIGVGFGKYQAGMASPAIHFLVLPGKLKLGFVMVKSSGIKTIHHAGHFRQAWFFRIKVLPEFCINLPTLRGVACRTVHFEVCAMRVLCEQVRNKARKEKDE